MNQALSIWQTMITSPKEGFGLINKETKIAFPLVLLLLIAMLSYFILFPIYLSEEYAQVQLRVVIQQMEQMGTTVSEAMLADIEAGIGSILNKSITIISAVIGAGILFCFNLFVGALIMLGLAKIFKCDISYGLIMRILLFVLLIPTAGMILKMIILVFSDWKSSLTSVQSAGELGRAISPVFSLNLFLPTQQMNMQLFYSIDFFTDIFNWLNYIFIFFGLSITAKIAQNKAIAITAITAGLSFIVGLAFTLLVP